MLWREAAPCCTRSEVLCGDGDLFWNGYSTQLPRPKNLQLDEPRFNSEKMRRVCEWSRVVLHPRGLLAISLCKDIIVANQQPLHSFYRSFATIRFIPYVRYDSLTGCYVVSPTYVHMHTRSFFLLQYTADTAFTAVLSTMYGEHKWPKTTMQSYRPIPQGWRSI